MLTHILPSVQSCQAALSIHHPQHFSQFVLEHLHLLPKRTIQKTLPPIPLRSVSLLSQSQTQSTRQQCCIGPVPRRGLKIEFFHLLRLCLLDMPPKARRPALIVLQVLRKCSRLLQLCLTSPTRICILIRTRLITRDSVIITTTERS